MGQVNILVAVNVSEAVNHLGSFSKTTQGYPNIGKYVFMIDTNDVNPGNPQGEGTNELTTHVTNGDTIVWSVVPIDPDNKIKIVGFNSIPAENAAVPNMINPQAYPQFDGAVWGAHVNEAGVGFQYSIVLELENEHTVSFDPFITSVNPV